VTPRGQGDQPDPVGSIERSLARIRRSQQAARLSGAPGASRADAAKYRYLDALSQLPEGGSISQIAQAISVDPPRGSRLTTELIERGWIERAGGQDARTASIRLTTEGRDVVDRMNDTRATAVAKALTGFTAIEQRRLAGLLARFVDAWPDEA
jgi:DNA-binding MarR family transcriptional regulator